MVGIFLSTIMSTHIVEMFRRRRPKIYQSKRKDWIFGKRGLIRKNINVLKAGQINTESLNIKIPYQGVTRQAKELHSVYRLFPSKSR